MIIVSQLKKFTFLINDNLFGLKILKLQLMIVVNKI